MLIDKFVHQLAVIDLTTIQLLIFFFFFFFCRIFCGTWNVNGRMPPADLDAWLLEYQVKDGEKHSNPPDIYAVG